MKRTIWFGIYAATVVLAILAAVFFPRQSYAATVRGNEQPCTAMASDVGYAAGLRDSGVPLFVVQKLAEDYISLSLSNPGDSPIKDMDDAELFRSTIEPVFEHPEITPADFEARFLAFCLKKPNSV